MTPIPQATVISVGAGLTTAWWLAIGTHTAPSSASSVWARSRSAHDRPSPSADAARLSGR